MPIYEYACQACGYEFESLQKLSDAPLVDCPSCSQPSLKKKISAAGFRLSGSGWYETDFKSSKQKNLAGDRDSGGSGTDKGGAKESPKEGKSEANKASPAKPETKTKAAD